MRPLVIVLIVIMALALGSVIGWQSHGHIHRGALDTYEWQAERPSYQLVHYRRHDDQLQRLGNDRAMVQWNLEQWRDLLHQSSVVPQQLASHVIATAITLLIYEERGDPDPYSLSLIKEVLSLLPNLDPGIRTMMEESLAGEDE